MTEPNTEYKKTLYGHLLILTECESGIKNHARDMPVLVYSHGTSGFTFQVHKDVVYPTPMVGYSFKPSYHLHFSNRFQDSSIAK